MSEPESLVERLETDAAYLQMLYGATNSHQIVVDLREAAAALSALRSRCETLERERDEAVRNADIVCDSYAAENQRLFDRARAAEAARDEAVRALEEAAERYTVFRQLLIDTMDTSPPTEGAQEFINRLTDAMEAAADKLDATQPAGKEKG